MLLSAVSVLVVAQSSSEIPEGLMNNPVYLDTVFCTLKPKTCGVLLSNTLSNLLFPCKSILSCIKLD